MFRSILQEGYSARDIKCIKAKQRSEMERSVRKPLHPKRNLGRGYGKEGADSHADWMEEWGPEKGDVRVMPRVLNLSQLANKVLFRDRQRDTEQKDRLGVEKVYQIRIKFTC